MNKSMHIYIYIHICIYTHVCMYVCAFTCMHCDTVGNPHRAQIPQFELVGTKATRARRDISLYIYIYIYINL